MICSCVNSPALLCRTIEDDEPVCDDPVSDTFNILMGAAAFRNLRQLKKADPAELLRK